MAINFHPARGAILVCDFNMLQTPEITKRRPVVVISHNTKQCTNLCTVVPITTTPPKKMMAYHHKLFFEPTMPEYDNEFGWVLGNMVYTLSFQRLHLLKLGKDANGNRIYDNRVISEHDLNAVIECVKLGIGIGN